MGERTDLVQELITLLDYALDSPKKRHIIGGILLSLSALFGRPWYYCYADKNGGIR